MRKAKSGVKLPGAANRTAGQGLADPLLDDDNKSRTRDDRRVTEPRAPR